MNIEEIRVGNLRRIIDDRFDGKAARLSEAIGRQSGYLSRVINGKKGFGEDFARDIERILELPHGYLDREDDESTLPQDVQSLLDTITTTAKAGTLTPEQAADFNKLIKTITGTK